MTLTRSTLGRLFAWASVPIADVMDAFVAADWTGLSTTGTVTPSLSGSQLRLSVNAGSGNRLAYYNAGTIPAGELFIVARQASQGTGGQPGIRAAIASVATIGDVTDECVLGSVARGFAGNHIAGEYAGDVLIQNDSEAANRNLPITHAISLRAGDLRARCLSNGGAIGSNDMSQAISGVVADGLNFALEASSSNANTFDYQRVAVMRGPRIIVNGPDVGAWAFRVRNAANAVIATSAAQVGGVAFIDCLTELDDLFPEAIPLAITIEIFEGATIYSGPETPDERLWGGDVWDWDGAELVPDAPAEPTVAEATRDDLNISWDAVADADGYRLERATDPDGPWTEIADQAGTSFDDIDLEFGTVYYYRVFAYNEWGESAASEVGSGETLFPATCAIDLDVYEEDGVTIAWSVSTDPAHDRPYLAPLTNYGAREIDPVTGSATLSTVQVEIIDKHQVPGDQQTGWMTERIGQVKNRRCRLRRYAGVSIGWVQIADGPAGTPRLHASYAGFAFQIRDTREAERRLRPFSSGGTCGIVPRGPIAGFGTKPDATKLLDELTPLTGKTAFVNIGAETICHVLFTDSFVFDSTLIGQIGWASFPEEFKIDEEGVDALRGVIIGERVGYTNADILWRVAGSGDPWNVARPSLPSIYFGTKLGGVQEGLVLGTTEEGDGLLSVILYCAETPPAGMPSAPDVEIEIIVRHRSNPSESLPYYFEGELGEFLTALYDRSLERAPDMGGDVHDPLDLDDALEPFGGGVRYDAAALALMTEPMVLRQTEKVPDGRSWAESALFAPSGWMPSLDDEGRISPTSRNRPATVEAEAITNANAEPTADWNAGERTITKVLFEYSRFFIPSSPFIDRGADGLAVRPIILEYRDADAPTVENDEPQSYDARAFSAVGTAAGDPISAFPESAAVLGQAARYEVLQRYARGAQAIRVRVKRSAIPTVREGKWFAVNLTWLPNLVTGFRGAEIAAAQVLSMENEECAFVTLLLEESVVVAEPGFYENGEKTEDEPEPGFYEEPTLISDEAE